MESELDLRVGGTWTVKFGPTRSELFREVSPTQVLCGEPSELRIISAHKGYAVVRCTIRDRRARPVNSEGPGIEQLQFAGKAAHSSTPVSCPAKTRTR